MTQGGWWWTVFLGSLVQSRCGEGGKLQTNNTGVCAQCLSHTGPAPAHGAHHSALGCSTGNRLRLALGCMCLPGLSHSGSGTQVVLRVQTQLGLHFASFPGPSSSGVWRAQSLRLIAFPISAAQFSGCIACVPSLAADDCPEPPEVLVRKEAFLHFGR